MKDKLYEEEGQMQVNGAVAAIITLIVGVGISVLVLIFVGVLSGTTWELVEDDIEAIANNVVVNESFTALINTTVSLDHSLVQTGTLGIVNATGANAIGLGNFTIDYTAGTVYLNTAVFNGTGMNASYTWGDIAIRDSIKDSVAASFSGLETTGDFLPIIVLAVVIFVVLALVLSFTAFGGIGSRGGSAL